LKSTPQGWRQFPITGIFSAKGKNMVKEIKPDQLNDMWKNARVPDDINFNVPGENKVSLDRTLAEEFRELKRNASKNLVQMALLAQGVRATNKNQSGDYTKQFHE
jgi:glycine cleavage system pyridoxal-binding protein P